MTELKSILLSVAINAAVTSTVVSLAIFWFKSWVSRKIDSTFTILELRAKAQIEIEQRQALFFVERRNTIYPEILEVVYRLRNDLRELARLYANEVLYLGGTWSKDAVEVIKRFNVALSILTENLYKYRAVVDENVFDQLHRFKRCLQDANVIIDRLTRRDEKHSQVRARGLADNQMAIHDSLRDRLQELSDECNTLYSSITESIKLTLEHPGSDRRHIKS